MSDPISEEITDADYPAPHAGGRPTTYDPLYCDKVVDMGKEGLSWTAIASELGHARSTLYLWMDNHEEFSVAMKRARELAMGWWEKVLMGQATGKFDGKSATAAIFAMKNQFPDDYRDRKEHKIDAEVGVFEIDFQGYKEPESTDS